MPLSSVFDWVRSKVGGGGQAERATSELKANAEKALQMKREAGSDRHIPPHQTANEGMQSPGVNDDTSRGSQEGGFTPQLKRTKVARSGDAS